MQHLFNLRLICMPVAYPQGELCIFKTIKLDVQVKLVFTDSCSVIIIIYFYQFGTGGHSQKAVRPVGCDYLGPWGEPIRIKQGRTTNKF